MIQIPLLRRGLRPAAALYSAVINLRARLYEKGLLKTVKVNPRVISIGNLTLGGAGKTPFAMRVAELLRAQNLSVAILCRGYKRRSGGRGAICLVSDGKKVFAEASQSGDEAQLMAQRLRDVSVVVGSPKWRAAQWIESHLQVDWIVLDDGFQHLKLARARNILLLDGERPFDNGEVIPLGRLRESPHAVQRADIVVLVRSENSPPEPSIPGQLKVLCPSAELFSAHRKCIGVSMTEGGSARPVEEIRGKRLLAFCGIARPDQFLGDLRGQQLTVAQSLGFPDHHRYRPSDTRNIMFRALQCGADALITTAKDAINLPPRAFGNWPCFVFEIEMKVNDEARFLQSLLT
ncbi:MAG: tetraacyldisaccharide 4'-kinase [Acidobacteriia bacterium]|nr:tetraacyldisaccharide 4'-kinase [Terriglobia bacterium]